MIEAPAGTHPIDGIVSTRRPLSVAATAERLAAPLSAPVKLASGVMD